MLGLHSAAVYLLVTASRTQTVVVPAERFIEVMLLPRSKPPKLRADNLRPERVSTNIAIALATPLLNSSLQSGSASAPDGRGAAVNWAAEARRAHRAFEIRRDQPQNSAMSVSTSLDEWWPREHHAGDRFKTDGGDWIVWISADCYEIASGRSNGTAFGAGTAQTICPPHGGLPRAD